MKRRSATFYCFSGPVMIATFAIEVVLAAYVLVRYKMTTATRLIAATLVLLAGFQFAEYQLCTGTMLFGAPWAPLGYVFITLLPPVGLSLVALLAKRKLRLLQSTAYLAAAGLITYFVLPGSVTAARCGGNYAIFQVTPLTSQIFSLYYFGFLLLAMTLAWRYRSVNRRALGAVLWGHVLFVVPTGIVNVVAPNTVGGTPSIMCGFAVIYALMLGLVIAPSVTKRGKR